MPRRLAILWAVLLAGFAAAPALAAPEQPLTISIDAHGAHARTLEHYESGRSIAIDAAAPPDIDGVTLTVTDPDGGLQTLPLAHAGPGHFTGTIALPDAGSYHVLVATSTAGTSTPTEPFAVDAEEPNDIAWLVGVGVGTGTFCLLGGVGFFALRRLALA
jgi:hypothetical protein